MQAAAEKPTQQSSFLPWQQPQALAGAKSPPVPIQAQVGTTQSWPSKPHIPAGPAQTPTSKSQALPGKPPAQGGMPPRKPQAASGVVQPQMSKLQGQAQAHPPSGNTAPVPPKAQAPPGATQPQVAKPQVQPQAQITKPAAVPHKAPSTKGAGSLRNFADSIRKVSGSGRFTFTETSSTYFKSSESTNKVFSPRRYICTEAACSPEDFCRCPCKAFCYLYSASKGNARSEKAHPITYWINPRRCQVSYEHPSTGEFWPETPSVHRQEFHDISSTSLY
ncbi:Uncharacterized protein HZ326_2970 [Fusarium oxysporum f. sp. albedinis]|nr:Uncharacterized protein HZ326_2970 [Fusarium oxysporum f. sp. albedinis]